MRNDERGILRLLAFIVALVAVEMLLQALF